MSSHFRAHAVTKGRGQRGLFTTLGIPLLRGGSVRPRRPRGSTSGDRHEAMIGPVAGARSVRRRFKVGSGDSGGPWFTVVGVVATYGRREWRTNDFFFPQCSAAGADPSGLETLSCERPWMTREDGGDVQARSSSGTERAAMARRPGRSGSRLPHAASLPRRAPVGFSVWRS